MKWILKPAVFTFLFIFSALSFARSSSSYTETMEKNIKTLYEAQTIEDLQAVVNTFIRIGRAEKNKWRPYYYSAFGNIMMSARAESPEDKDAYLDKAGEELKKALALKTDEAELVALEGFILMLRIPIDPANRGPQYSGMATGALAKAAGMDPENPRALFLLAQMQMGTAQFFGSDTSEACATLDKAIELFEMQKLMHPLDPAWGKDMAMAVKKQCK